MDAYFDIFATFVTNTIFGELNNPNNRNGCMQEYEDVLKRASSLEMKNFQLFHRVS